MPVMQSNAILVLGDENDTDLRESLFSIGLIPLYRENMQDLLGKLRQGAYDAVVVDQDQERADVLELLLNVRDLNETIPVIILGAQKSFVELDQMLGSQPHAFMIKKSTSPKTLGKKLKEVINSGGEVQSGKRQ